MRKQALTVEWHIAKSDADWERLHVPSLPDITPAATRRLHLNRSFWCVAALVLLLVSAGGWWWRTDQAALPQPTAKVTATVHPALGDAGVISLPGDQAAWAGDHTTTDGRGQGVQEDSSVPTGIQTFVSAARLDIALPPFEVQGDQAVARVVMYTEHGEPAYRQTRFYRRIGPDWRQTKPDAALWGPQRSLETPSFLFRFRQNDAPAVIAVAPQLEELNTALRRNFGLPGTRLVGQPIAFIEKKLVIDVRVTQPPGQTAIWFQASDRILVSSPAVYLAPIGLTDVELLAQSISLPLLEQLLAQAHSHYAIKPPWQPMLHGLRLWQVWDLGLPLAVWREDVVKWVYFDLPTLAPGQVIVLPERYKTLCATHSLWMSSPAQLNIPLVCTDHDTSFLSAWRPREPLIRLTQLAVPMSPGEYIGEPDNLDWPKHPGHTVALAMLIEYTVTTYGRERLPALVAGLGQYDTWETLLPAVFGISTTEFEAGWQAYLATRYGVSPDTIMP